MISLASASVAQSTYVLFDPDPLGETQPGGWTAIEDGDVMLGYGF